MNVLAGDGRLYVGNSITWGGANEGGHPWHAPPGGLDDQIQATWGPAPAAQKNAGAATGAASVAVTGAAGVVTATIPGYRQTVVLATTGSSGANSSQLAALLPALFLAVPEGLVSPMFVIEGSINDAHQIWAGSRTLAQFQTGKASQYSQILARWPAARIADLTCLCMGELWVPGPAWDNFGDDEILLVDDAMKVLAAANGVEVVDTRAALLSWEVINNPASDPGGHAVLLEGNNVHPTLAGMAVMAAEFLATIPVTP